MNFRHCGDLPGPLTVQKNIVYNQPQPPNPKLIGSRWLIGNIGYTDKHTIIATSATKHNTIRHNNIDTYKHNQRKNPLNMCLHNKETIKLKMDTKCVKIVCFINPG